MDKSAIIERAQKYAAKGQLDKAIEEWQKLIQETPNDGNIYNTIGDLQLKRSSSQKAVEAYLKAADAFLYAGFELKTIAVYKKVIKIHTGRLDVCEKLADLNATRGLSANAIEEYHRVAKQYAKLGNMKAVLTVYQKIADLDANNVHARIRLAEMCIKEGFKDQAVEAYSKALEFYRSKDQQNEAGAILKHIHGLQPGFQEKQQEKSEPKDTASIVESPPSVKESADRQESAPENVGKTLDEHTPAEESTPPSTPVVEMPSKPAPINQTKGTTLSETSGTVAADTTADYGNVEIQAEPTSISEDKSAEISLPSGKTVIENSSPVEKTQDVVPPAEPSAPSEPLARPLTPEEIQNRMTEAEVYLKYGLQEKARDQFIEVLKGAPEHVEAYLQLKEIYTREGEAEKTFDLCQKLANLYAKRGETERQKEVLDELNNLKKSVSDDAESGEVPVTDDQDQPEAVPDNETSLEPTPSPLSSVEEDPHNEQLLKGEQYLKEGRRNDARRIFIKILDSDPDHTLARKRLLEIEEVEDRESSRRQMDIGPSGEREHPVQSADGGTSLEETSFENISGDFDKSFSEIAPEEVETSAKKAAPLKDMTDDLDNLGEASDFVDLTSLLDGVDGPNSPQKSEEPSNEVVDEIDTIFEEFQRGFQEQPAQEDVETHFNLGIAYREMGLFNDAINEFKQSMSGERFVDSALMLSICYHQRGMTKESEELLRSLMNDSRCSEEQRLLVKYELGVILAEGKKANESQKLFREVYSADPNFRDVASKVGAKGEALEGSNKKKGRISYL